MDDERILLKIVSGLMIPLILLFALYVQFHGDFGPGGGFQAGVIFASAFVLYGILYGVDAVRRVFPAWLNRLLLAFGVLLYAGVGVAGLFKGGHFLDYSVLMHNPISGQHLGITLIEFGVGATVAGAVVSIFVTFASQDLRYDDGMNGGNGNGGNRKGTRS